MQSDRVTFQLMQHAHVFMVNDRERETMNLS